MSLSHLQPGAWLYDRRTGAQRLLHAVERYGQVIFLSFKHPQTGAVERQPFALAEAESRFEALTGPSAAFRDDLPGPRCNRAVLVLPGPCASAPAR